MIKARRTFLGLGSNLGDRKAYLRDAVAALVSYGLSATSPVYETDPVGGPEGQGPYLNLVVELLSTKSPHELLEICKQLETAAGRVRDERWGPRTLDVDILWIEGISIQEPNLVIPHPRMWERRFVLDPLRDLAPELVKETVLKQSVGYVKRLGLLGDLDKDDMVYRHKTG